jgi:SAM-dependent methyltransferase
MAASLAADAPIKSCCADLYAQDWVRLLLGDSFHPGGPALTRRLGTLLGLGPHDHVLDVAAGPGVSALEIARTFGCRVSGVDFSAEQVTRANAAAAAEGLADRVQFQQGDAEQLPFDDGRFDALVCECAFCTFPDKPTAASELFRMLRPGGRLGLSDIALDPARLPASLQGVLGVVACIADARPVEEHVELLAAAGFGEFQVEDHAPALRELVKQVDVRLLAVKVAVALGKHPGGTRIGAVDLTKAKPLLAEVRAQIASGNATYVAITAAKPVS